jgi:hypothetical protein
MSKSLTSMKPDMAKGEADAHLERISGLEYDGGPQ